MEKGASAAELLMDAFAENGRIDLIPEGDGIEGMEIMVPANEAQSPGMPLLLAVLARPDRFQRGAGESGPGDAENPHLVPAGVPVRLLLPQERQDAV